MSNKQKLPKHITAHELLCKDVNCDMVLMNKGTEKCWAINSKSQGSITMAISILSDSEGWDKDLDVGKQIVF